MPVEVVLVVHGGVVQEAFCSEPNASFILVDWDTAGDPADDTDVVSLRLAAKTRHVLVQPIAARPLHDLAGSETERAIEAAFEQGVLLEPAQ